MIKKKKLKNIDIRLSLTINENLFKRILEQYKRYEMKKKGITLQKFIRDRIENSIKNMERY